MRQDVPDFARDMEVISLDLGSLYEMFSDRKLNHLKVREFPAFEFDGCVFAECYFQICARD